MELTDIIEHITCVLRQQGCIAAAYLLGSAVSGRLHRGSDIDIALLPADGNTISLRDRLELAALLETKLGRTVDIGIITPQNLVYAYEAILKGLRIVTPNADYADMMETNLLGSYIVLREDRHEVEEAYHAA